MRPTEIRGNGLGRYSGDVLTAAAADALWFTYPFLIF